MKDKVCMSSAGCERGLLSNTNSSISILFVYFYSNFISIVTMMMSYLCQRTTVTPANQLPSASAGDADILSVQTLNGHENILSEHCSTCRPDSSSPASCDPSFISDSTCAFRHVSKCLISGTASGFVRSTSGISPSINIERYAAFGMQSGSVSGVTDATSEVTSISVDELATSLNLCNLSCKTGRPAVDVAAVVDCRGFVSFNANHVISAFNASCGDRFARKRLLDGKITVADLISGGPETVENSSRDQYRLLVKMAVDHGSAIVAYDDDTKDVTSLPATHPLKIITEYLKKTGAAIKYLTGGLQAFHAAYPMMCSKPRDPPSRPLLYSPTTPVVEMDVDSAVISEILPHLFIGNERDAASKPILDENAINSILNVTSHVPFHFENDASMTCKRLPATDNGCQNLKQYFEDAIIFIESARCSGDKVLVHCQAGVSRSPTIVLAYLMARYNWSMMTAFCYVKSRRHIIAPNFNFMGQLLEFEKRCASGELRHCLRDDIPHVPLSFVAQEPCENMLS